ncbi:MULTISPECIES: hypothetical protein [Streptomyces]|uniref:Uncharacterized protein n=3 Tax=Actinomycetes TaxID=1760 RepID=A0A1E7LTD5_9ACTN|nr:hypothetical protein [Streptomyces nanshensis]OEV19411.1 hypothetical protein AN221_16415 [Streptomyces nanshensis]
MTTLLAAGAGTSALGPMSATTISVILIVTLIYGIKGKGRKKLALGPAQAVGFFAELAFLRAGSWPHDLGTAVQDIPRQVAENPDLGGIGMTGVVIILLVLSAFAPLVPFTGALWGMLTAAAMAAAQGSIWRAVIAVATAGLSLVGA